MKPVTPTSARPSRPRARRLVGAVVAGVLAISVLAGCLSEDQTTVQAQINYSRAVYGAHSLADYGPADTKAQNWANYLASIGTIKHSTLTSGYAAGTWCRLGENVGMGPSLLSINTAFLNSPSHRANMLSPYYDHFGTGVAKRGNTYFVVQEFVDVC